MSRTDRDLPYWYVAATEGRVDHDHRWGVCVPDTFDAARERAGGGRGRHRVGCAQRSLVWGWYHYPLLPDPESDCPGCRAGRPSCDLELTSGDRRGWHTWYTTPPRWWRNARTHNPARTEVRACSTRARGEYNAMARAGGLDEDGYPLDASAEDAWEPATHHGEGWWD